MGERPHEVLNAGPAVQQVVAEHHVFFRLPRAHEPVQVNDRLHAIARGIQSSITPRPSSITSPPTKMAPLLSARWSVDGRATASPCEITRSTSASGRRLRNQPPRLAHAEPVAGSSRTPAAPAGKKNRAITWRFASPSSKKTYAFTGS